MSAVELFSEPHAPDPETGNAHREKPTALVWSREAVAGSAQDLCRAAGLQPISAGSPDSGRSGAVAEAMSCAAITDLRAAVAAAEVSIVVLASPGDFGEHDADLEAVAAATARGAVVVSLEPFPGSGSVAANTGWLEGTGEPPITAVRVLPRLSITPGVLEAREIIRELTGDAPDRASHHPANLGPMRSMHVISGSPPALGSAGARLHNAVGLLDTLAGAPEFIDAGLAPSTTLDQRRLSDISGAFHGLFRYADGKTATITASNGWSRYEHRIDLLFDTARLTITPVAVTLYDPDGSERDRFRADSVPNNLIDLAAIQIRAMLDATQAPASPPDAVSILATLDAVMMSCRSGQPESPSVTRRALGH